MGRALEEGISRSGYGVHLVSTPEQAENALKVSDYFGLISDCMLPKINGVDFIEKIKPNLHPDCVIILISGIYRDTAFALDAQRRTGAKVFLNKPFDMQSLIGEIDSGLKHLVDSEKHPLHEILRQTNTSPKEKITSLNNCEFVHGFDLPLIYNILLDSKVSGDLQIQYEAEKVSTVGFQKGRIDKVDHPDTDSFFGVLLIEKGFITNEELEKNLKNKGNKKIGEALVASSSLSPHAIEIIQHDQMIIRISKTIQDTSVKVHFVENEKVEPKIFLDSTLLAHLLGDWITSKISVDWLKGMYNAWLDNPILDGPNRKALSQYELIRINKLFCTMIDHTSDNQGTLVDLLEKSPSHEAEILQSLHFLMTQKVFVFGHKTSTGHNFVAKFSRYKKIEDEFKVKNYFEILGVSKRASSREVQRAYHELAKNLHPDKLTSNCPDDLKSLAQSVFAKITEAHQVLSHEEKRNQYIKTLQMGFTEEILQAESAFDEGKRLLMARQFRDARKQFESTLKMKGRRSDTVVYLIWAYIKEKRRTVDKMELVEKLRSLFEKVAHEDRHSAPYFLIRGMYYELNGQIEKAYKYFQHASATDPYLTDAKRELAYLKQKYKKKPTTFSEDLLTKIFTKKTG